MFAENDFAIVGDGKRLAIVFGGIAYILKDCLPRSCDFTMKYDSLIECDLHLMCGGIESTAACNVNIKNAEAMSILELLSEINRKINERGI